ncbi:hypothetical protein LEP1GSC043_2858 [Leptospira weilii str. Ecochallenge]|uniref:Uncharacterized protein n=1 Tax=Leptospira weilii str. Ecochallenge TaxID=1049986 RepID=N1U569_9LEPT|nr:hypothetical protein LEP1GSC043_2858 [Leptospira weilii str. Ecochallenge]
MVPILPSDRIDKWKDFGFLANLKILLRKPGQILREEKFFRLNRRFFHNLLSSTQIKILPIRLFEV